MEMAEKMIAYFGSGSSSAGTNDDFADLLRNISGKEIDDFGRLLSSDDAESVASSSSLPPYIAPEMNNSLYCLQPARSSLSTTHMSAVSDCPLDLSSPPIRETDVHGKAMNNPFSFHGSTELAANPSSAPQIPSRGRHTDRVYINSSRRGLDPPLKRPSTSPASRASTKRTRRSGSVSSRNSSSTRSSSTESICLVCGAPSSGKHYEIECCDGCKAFFRRCIRSKTEYKCEFDGKCGTARCVRQCRSCRLRKCIAVGMNENKVQYERDRMPRKVCRRALKEDSVVRKQAKTETDVVDRRTTATLADVADHLSLLAPTILRWAKEVPGFERFSEEDQSALITLHREPYLIVEIAMQSLSHQSRLLLGEKHVICRESSASTSRFCDLISEEILNPLRDLNLDETEFLFLRSILLFDATSPWVADKSLLQKLQMNCFLALQQHVGDKIPGMSTRFGQISFLINAFNLAAYELSSMLRKAGLRSNALN